MAKKTSTGFNEWHYRQQDAIAQGSLTNSKRPECLVKGVYPTHFKIGTGCFLFDMDNKQYVDFICGLGTNLLGYAQTQVTAAIVNQAQKGCSYSLASTLEVQAAEKVKEMFPFVERVKFLKSGSEACSAAIRIARAHTGRDLVLSEGYHGFHDDFVSLTPPAAGVPAREFIKKFTSLDAITKGVAAVIIEPVMTDASPKRSDWLNQLRDKCTETGTLLIFDEVITGFRFEGFGVSNHWNIRPDLICLGKAIANGMPLAAVGGKAAVMDNPNYFVSSTYAGETLSLAAAIKTMHLLQTTYSPSKLWDHGNKFLEKFNSIHPMQKVKIEGYAVRGVFIGDQLSKALFWQEACKAGLLFGPSWFYNFPHIDVSDWVLNVCRDIMIRLNSGSIQLEGELPSSPFAQKMRESA